MVAANQDPRLNGLDLDTLMQQPASRVSKYKPMLQNVIDNTNPA